MINKVAFVLLLTGLTAFTQNAQAGRRADDGTTRSLTRHAFRASRNVTPLTPLTFVGDGYVILNINGAGNTFYNLNNAGDTINPKFDSNDTSATAFSLTITINQGQSILLGGELQTFPSVVGSSAFLGYRITNLAETTGSFSELNLPFNTNVGSNDKWQQLASPGGVQIGSSLAPGNYLLEVYQHGANGADNTFNQEGVAGNNWEAQITVVPEPATVLLVGPALLAGMFFVRRRRA